MDRTIAANRTMTGSETSYHICHDNIGEEPFSRNTRIAVQELKNEVIKGDQELPFIHNSG